MTRAPPLSLSPCRWAIHTQRAGVVLDKRLREGHWAYPAVPVLFQLRYLTKTNTEEEEEEEKNTGSVLCSSRRPDSKMSTNVGWCNKLSPCLVGGLMSRWSHNPQAPDVAKGATEQKVLLGYIFYEEKRQP